MANIARACLPLHGIGRRFEERDGDKAILLLVGPLLLNFLQLKYQGKNVTSFDTHPITMYISTTSFLAYLIACDVKERLSLRQVSPTCTYMAHFRAWFFGYISLASLASVIYPNLVIFVPYLLCFTPAIIELLYRTYSRIREWHFQETIMLVLDFFTGLWGRIVEFGTRIVTPRAQITNEMKEGNEETEAGRL